MASEIKIETKEVYDFLPPLSFRTGDIWSCLPTFGILQKELCTAIVLTPACDLANYKCETITYLPILTIEEYCSHPPFFPEIYKFLLDLFDRSDLQEHAFPIKKFQLPSKLDLTNLLAEIPRTITKIKDQEKIILKIRALIDYTEIIRNKQIAPISIFERIFGEKNFSRILECIITNSYKSDIHFLPSDGKPSSSSIIQAHSVALFRYPLSIPVGVLELAQTSDIATWEATTQKFVQEFPTLSHFSRYPLKYLSLKNEFLADLISRYVGMYIRLGSRDFTESAVQELSRQIRGQA